jgi:cytochrome c-type biogenesis protein CcmH/NrfF
VLLPLAHAGHWILWILYALPVIVVVASIVISARRERRRDGAPDSTEAEPAPDELTHSG